MHVLVINCGSSSVKYVLLQSQTEAIVASGRVERVRELPGGFQEALQQVLASLGDAPVEAVGHRVVHGGERFTAPVRVTDEVVEGIQACVPLAPLHNPSNLAGIEAARAVWPDLPHVAVFDTAFHYHLPRRARTYALDAEVAASAGIRRYGFHGMSHAFVAHQAAAWLETPLADLRLIVCHLGNGASVCAVEAGHSVETSMGMTPLEGLVMGTRSGDIDPGVVLELVRRHGGDVEAVDALLNQRSGLLGLSGVSNDLRDIEERAAAGDERCRAAISVFAHRVRKYIGAYAAVMGGVDAVILTGGIGENGAAMRQRLLQRFEYLGLRFSEERNADARVSREARVADISARNSRVRALVIATDEEIMIAREAAKVAQGAQEIRSLRPIPVAVSARHVHVTEATFHKLFGPDAQLTERRPLSQPGQFAAEQVVTLVGPRRRLENVRILGPFRSKDQVEISRTDEFHLGVDAPVRLSGQTAGSAPITLEGPAGSVALTEGLICAWRHIHMTPEDAEAYGVHHNDEVEVAVSGHGRGLVFRDVVIRVDPSFKLEMHIDTDEANAADLPQHSEGALVGVEGAEGTLQRRRTPSVP